MATQKSTGSSKKYLKFGLIVVLFILAFFIGVSYEKSRESVANTKKVTHEKIVWTTYNDNTRKFSIKYPSTWEVASQSTSTELVLKRKGSKTTKITLLYPTSPKPAKTVEKSVGTQNMSIGTTTVTFDTYFTKLGAPTYSHASLTGTSLGTTITDVYVALDTNHTHKNAATVKKILSSFKTLP